MRSETGTSNDLRERACWAKFAPGCADESALEAFWAARRVDQAIHFGRLLIELRLRALGEAIERLLVLYTNSLGHPRSQQFVVSRWGQS